MENKPQENGTGNQESQNDSQNANSAYSGSGSWQPGGGTGEAGKLSDLESSEVQKENDSVQGEEKNYPFTNNAAPDNGTDPSKLSDI